jgi:cytosine/adenosine deaminase-related metal-dependent hydrolase
MKILVKDGYILTLDDQNTIYERGDIWIEDDRIISVGRDLDFQLGEADKVIDASGKIVMPGLVNAHFHSGERLMRGMASGYPNELWNLFVYPAIGTSFDLEPRLLYLQTVLGAIESVKNGVTSVHDQAREWSLIPYQDAPHAYFSAYEQAGLRTAIAIDVVDVPWHETIPEFVDRLPSDLLSELTGKDLGSDWKLSPIDEVIELCETYIDRWHGYDGRFSITISPSAPQRCSEEMLIKLAEIAQEHDLLYTSHLLETRIQFLLGKSNRFNGSFVRYLDDLGLLWPKACYAHVIWVTDDDLDLLAKNNCSVMHLPICNLYMGSGVMPYKKMKERGIHIALGSDGVAGSGNMSMFDSMKMASLIHNISTPQFEDWPTSWDVLRMATREGNFGMGSDNEIGELSAGKKADLIILEKLTESFVPFNNVADQLVFAESGSSVETVIINGKVVMEDRKLATINEQDILDELKTYQPKLDKFCQNAVTTSKRFYPHLYQIYQEAVSEVERCFKN